MKTCDVDAIVLAGGFGTRLQSVVKDVPKPMADISGKPFLTYVMSLLEEHGIDRVILSVGYKHEVIEAYFGRKYRSLSIDYVVDPEPLGTGGAIREALRVARGSQTVIINGDTFFNVDIRKMVEAHNAKKADITLALKSMTDFDRYGAVVVERGGRISGFSEKAFHKSGYINGGVYIVNKSSMSVLQNFGKTFSFETDFLQNNLGSFGMYAFPCDQYFIDIGISSDYTKAQHELPAIMRERMQ